MTTIQDAAVRDALRAVHYPGVEKDVVTSGLLRRVELDGANVTVKVDLPTMAVSVAVQTAFEAALLAALLGVPGIGETRVKLEVRVAPAPTPLGKQALPRIKNIILVASGKGGVGKSTVATNLALSFKRWGAKVGLLDADIFGPSVPHMLGTPESPAGGTADKRIAPAVYFGMKVISTAFFVEQDDAVVWRGPMIHKLLKQFFDDVDWGELDYLVIDMPPGTGDVQLSLSQLVPVAGALMVTTPQTVALLDVVKGVSMFKKVEIPILGVIENMSGYTCVQCGHHDEVFSKGGGARLARSIGVPLLGEIPLERRVREAGDDGTPIAVGAPESQQAQVYMDVAAAVAQSLVVRSLAVPRRTPGLNLLK
ncbi:MAG: iron-sulfur cluster carrier protein ApbC [Myxococcales bacterium]|nr:iron-sulfur cluster carrier protein ApbC [Myxococcales bacterium]